MADKSIPRVVMTRKEAMAAGLKRYFSGVPCARGHIADRWVKGPCCQCDLDRTQEWRERNLQHVLSYSRDYRQENLELCRERERLRRLQNLEEIRERERQERLEKPEQQKARWRRHYLKHRERHLERRRRYCTENPDKVRACRSRWRLENQEKNNARHRRYRLENPLIVKAQKNRRRARLMAAEGRFTAEHIADLERLQRNRCAMCRCSILKKYHIDHIIPLSKGGSNWPRNLQLLCPTCNTRKHAKDPIEFAQSLGLLC